MFFLRIKKDKICEMWEKNNDKIDVKLKKLPKIRPKMSKTTNIKNCTAKTKCATNKKTLYN